MADLTLGGGGGGGGATSGQLGNTSWLAYSPLNDPRLASLFNTAKGSVPTQMPSLREMITGSINSPLLSAVLGPALQRLQAPQADQRMQLTDAARAAGGLRGSPYMSSYTDLLSKQGQQTNDLIGTVIQQMLSPLLQSQLQEQRNLFLPANAYTDLLQASRPQVITGNNANFSGGSSSSSTLGNLWNGGQMEGIDQDWLKRIGYQPTTGGGGGIGPGTTPYTPWPNDMSNLPLGGVGGAPGGSQITYNPQTGFYESAPSAAAMDAGKSVTEQSWWNDPSWWNFGGE